MRALSGIQATGNITIGNYLGALQRWAASQDKYDENFYFVPDLHTLTVRQEPKELTEATYSTVAWLLAVGIDPQRSTIYLQSQIPAHSELCWILNNFVTMGELSRMTQYKEKIAKRSASGQVAGLFVYPALMAADILLYDADVVPTGEDQVQHIELARNIASRFNKLYGDVFKLPKTDIDKQTARIMDLQNPANKMSKSESADSLGVIRMLDGPEEIEKKISKAVTDSGSAVAASKDKPALTNLINIYSALTDSTKDEVEAQFKGKSYGDFKATLADVIVSVFKPLQQRYSTLINDKDQIKTVLAEGKRKAEPIANSKLDIVKKKLGLLD